MSKAHVDLATGKIYGCEEGSLKWYHEEGHLVFNSSAEQSWILMLKSYVFDFLILFIMASIVIRIVFPLAVSFWTAYTAIGIYEEWWCNRYAKLNFTKEMMP